ncbi:RepA leader peptide Tap [Salmonella enterica subsp. enterica]|uniref:RepA leader peptide Tap n=13 Tax=Salmonella enterica TaxID=28901 RepID=A0A5H3HK11_SALMO|nr:MULTISPECIES: RepA leader peptide Tap [Salmonella]EAA1783742.1 RepA leader peptide Tap [Salmonella enterica subsp. diarizonae]EAA3556628.1 RepA leader peptide Tap [Salmonella enterica subsp. enterica serovar Montevideo]EAA4514156.1 RepA leader peptide Tap [Salmonella enterica subsp. enterica serovar Vitkin]EAA5587860.1 RepA leader peptide Tap [Salmonella enterica subsp. enterica serovar Muenchen]EAA6543367.1 RepA leader peptide Tap [Salmonella enterica subsp. enterica serovar Blockley]EAB7
MPGKVQYLFLCSLLLPCIVSAGRSD